MSIGGVSLVLTANIPSRALYVEAPSFVECTDEQNWHRQDAQQHESKEASRLQSGHEATSYQFALYI